MCGQSRPTLARSTLVRTKVDKYSTVLFDREHSAVGRGPNLLRHRLNPPRRFEFSPQKTRVAFIWCSVRPSLFQTNHQHTATILWPVACRLPPPIRTTPTALHVPRHHSGGTNVWHVDLVFPTWPPWRWIRPSWSGSWLSPSMPSPTRCRIWRTARPSSNTSCAMHTSRYVVVLLHLHLHLHLRVSSTSTPAGTHTWPNI